MVKTSMYCTFNLLIAYNKNCILHSLGEEGGFYPILQAKYTPPLPPAAPPAAPPDFLHATIPEFLHHPGSVSKI